MVNKKFVLLGFLFMLIVVGAFYLGRYYGEEGMSGDAPGNTAVANSNAPAPSNQDPAMNPEWREIKSKVQSLITRHDLDKAVSLLDDFIAKNPGSGVAKVALAACYIEKKDLVAAEKHLKEAEKLLPENDYYVNMVFAALAKAKKDYESAKQYVTKAMESADDQQKAFGYYNFASVYFQMNDYASAKENIEKALQRNPDNKDFKSLASEIDKRNDIQKRAAPAVDSEWREIKSKVQGLITRRDLDKAVSLLDDFIAKNPGSGVAKVALAACYIEKKDLVAAEKHLKEAEKLLPENDYYVNMVFVALAQAKKDYESAKQYVTKAMESADDQQKAFGYYNFASVYFQMNDYASAKENIEKALQRNPDNKDFKSLASKIKNSIPLKLDTAAISEWSQIKQTIMDLRLRRDFDKAISLLNGFIAKHPHFGITKAVLASCYIEKDDLAAAEKHLKEAEDLSPKNDYYVNRIYTALYLAKKDYVKARELAKRTLERAADNQQKAHGYYDFASIYLHMNDRASAKENINKALLLIPGEKSFQKLANQISAKPGN